MKCAFNVQLAEDTMAEETSQFLEEEDDDDESILAIEAERVSCYAHTLQLVIHDGLQQRRSFSGAVSKASKIYSLLHTSAAFKVIITMIIIQL